MLDPVNEKILLALLPVMEGLAPSAALIVNPDREIDKLELFTPEYEPLATIIVSPSEAIEIADFKSPKGFSSDPSPSLASFLTYMFLPSPISFEARLDSELVSITFSS